MNKPQVGGLLSWNERDWFLITSFEESKDNMVWRVKGVQLGSLVTETDLFFGQKRKFYHDIVYKAPSN